MLFEFFFLLPIKMSIYFTYSSNIPARMGHLVTDGFLRWLLNQINPANQPTQTHHSQRREHVTLECVTSPSGSTVGSLSHFISGHVSPCGVRCQNSVSSTVNTVIKNGPRLCERQCQPRCRKQLSEKITVPEESQCFLIGAK